MSTSSIRKVRGQIVELSFGQDHLPALHDLLEVKQEPAAADGKSLLLEVHGYLGDRNVQTIALGSTLGLKRGQTAHVVHEELTQDPDQLLGVVIDGLGNILTPDFDLKTKRVFGHKRGHASQHLKRKPVKILDPQDTIATNIAAIDLLNPILRGGKVGLFGGAGVGKTELLKGILHTFLNSDLKENPNRIAVFAGVGERIREAQELVATLTKDEPEILKRVVFVFGQMDKTAGERSRAAHTAVRIAEMYRDTGHEVLLFMDSLFRFVQAGAEISTMLGRMPSVLGYQSTLEVELGQLLERICSYEGEKGSITAIQCIFVPADDMNDPAIVAIQRHLDTTIILDREITKKNIARGIESRYPAVDLLASSSKMESLDFHSISRIDHNIPDRIRLVLRKKKELDTKDKYNLLDNEESEFFGLAKHLESLFSEDFRSRDSRDALKLNRASHDQLIIAALDAASKVLDKINKIKQVS